MNKSLVPNGFTSANLGFGVLGITFSSEGHFVWAAICVLLSLAADALDGRTARALGVSGPLGRELDSLADVVGFGVAPAYMMYCGYLQSLGWMAYIPLLVFSILGAFRLARFNIMTTEVKGYFQGLAIPTAGCLCATYVLAGVRVNPWLLALFMIIAGVLMVSNIRYPDFKGKGALTIQKAAIYAVVIIGILLLWWDYHVWPVLPFALYTLFGIINAMINEARS